MSVQEARYVHVGDDNSKVNISTRSINKKKIGFRLLTFISLGVFIYSVATFNKADKVAIHILKCYGTALILPIGLSFSSKISQELSVRDTLFVMLFSEAVLGTIIAIPSFTSLRHPNISPFNNSTIDALA